MYDCKLCMIYMFEDNLKRLYMEKKFNLSF